MRNILEDFELYNYTTSKEIFLNMIHEKRPQDNYDVTPRNTEVLFNVLIEELDKSKKENIFFTGKHLKAMYSDVKNGIFIFRGVILENDKETINLVKETMKGKSFNQFIKQIRITKGALKDNDEVNILREYRFKGFVSNFMEFYDNKNNYIFEFVVCRRKILYRDDIFIKRLDNGMVCIAKVTSPIKMTIPVAKNNKIYYEQVKKGKLKNLQIGNTFWAVSGIALATLAIAGSVGTVGAGALAITIVYGANTIISCSYSIYLDYNERDNEMDLDTLYNNPLKFSFGEFLAKSINENWRSAGHMAYYGSEVFLGAKGLNEMRKAFNFGALFKNKKVVKNHNLLGELEGMEKVLDFKKIGYDGYQGVDGTRGVYNNSKDFSESAKGFFKPVEKVKPVFKPITNLGNGGN